MNEQWFIRKRSADFDAISKKFNITPQFARVLRNRNLTSDEQISEYLFGSAKDLHDPFLYNDMDKAADLILRTIHNRKKIRIIGDYDADGVCSSYILEKGLNFLGAFADVRIPDRTKDGYGINIRLIEEASTDDISLIITCDNGISAHDECLLAASRNIDVIITDHHEPRTDLGLPSAFAVIDQKRKDSTYPFRELCGAAVAYKLIEALFKIKFKSDSNDNNLSSPAKNLLDQLIVFAGIATITDIVPLIGENRIFAKEGLRRINESVNPGLRALINTRSLNASHISATNVGFVIGPCINSAGRLKSASIALELFETTDESHAKKISEQLSELNELRKKMTEEQSIAAIDIIEKKVLKTGSPDKIIVVFLPDAHESIAGIIAGKIKEKYNRPAIVITDTNGVLKGSCRSTDACNIIETLSNHSGFLQRFGGHAKAAGFTLQGSDSSAVDLFSKALNSGCQISDEDLIPRILADFELLFENITFKFIDELSLLEPTGTDNPPALFAGKNIQVLSHRVVGQNRNALKMKLRSERGKSLDAIMFGNPDEILITAENLEKVKAGNNSCPIVSILFYPQINEFRGYKSIQLKIEHIRV